MPDLTPDLGDLIAIYAAAAATFLGLRQWRRERNPLYITLDVAYPASFEDEDGNWQPGISYYRVRVVNRGSAPIAVESFGIGLEIDWRRIHPAIVGNWRTISGARVKSGEFKLGVFDSVEGDVLQGEIDGQLYGPPPVFIRDPERTLEYWEGTAPLRFDHVWAQDIAQRRNTGKISPVFRNQGYMSWDESAPPVLRGRFKAWWLRTCMAVYDSRRFGLGSTGGPRIINFLHRLRLFPIQLPGSN